MQDVECVHVRARAMLVFDLPNLFNKWHVDSENLFSGKRKSERNEENLSGKLIVSVAVVSMHSPLSLLLIVSGFENPDYGRDLHMQINITSREIFSS